MLKAIVFDFDGVIVDSEPLHYRAFARVGREVGKTFTWQEYLQTYVGFDDRDAFRVMLGLTPGMPGRPEDESRICRLAAAKACAFEREVELGIEPVPGVMELIREARQAMPVAIASGATRADIDMVLGRLQLGECFPVIVSADAVARSKPDPSTYRMAVKELARYHRCAEIIPAACLAIEDTAAGIASAQGAGLHTLGLARRGDGPLLGRASRVVRSLEGVGVSQLQEWFAGAVPDV